MTWKLKLMISCMPLKQLPTLYLIYLTGPISLPIIGSLIQVVRSDPGRPFVAFQKLARTYGNIMSLQLGSVNAGMSASHNIRDPRSVLDFFLQK
jgi:hypothetical protein